MDAVTYPDTKVINFIEQHFVPLRVSFDARPLSDEFSVKWTPTLVTLDSDGKEHHRTVGFLPPDELISSLYLGIAKACFNTDQVDKALVYLDNLLTEFPKSDFAPEALYLQGVCGYKSTHTAQPLKDAYEKLKKHYPTSEWVKRAYPYRLL
ncbi:MAG: tetratricopeptide repeat protein [Nitrospirae bacterium]|nr:tetratricopeptide repeat protein [Nitrospirota bacterium]